MGKTGRLTEDGMLGVLEGQGRLVRRAFNGLMKLGGAHSGMGARLSPAAALAPTHGPPLRLRLKLTAPLRRGSAPSAGWAQCRAEPGPPRHPAQTQQQRPCLQGRAGRGGDQYQGHSKKEERKEGGAMKQERKEAKEEKGGPPGSMLLCQEAQTARQHTQR